MSGWTLTVDGVYDIRGRGRILAAKVHTKPRPKRGDVVTFPDGSQHRLVAVEGSVGAFGPLPDVGLVFAAEVPASIGTVLRGGEVVQWDR